MRRCRGQKFRSQKRNSEMTSFSFLARNTARSFVLCRSEASRRSSTATRWNCAAERTCARPARLSRSASLERKRSQRVFGGLKLSPVMRRGSGRRKRLFANRRNLKCSLAKNPTWPRCPCLKSKPKLAQCSKESMRARRISKSSRLMLGNGKRKGQRRARHN